MLPEAMWSMLRAASNYVLLCHSECKKQTGQQVPPKAYVKILGVGKGMEQIGTFSSYKRKEFSFFSLCQFLILIPNYPLLMKVILPTAPFDPGGRQYIV